jgi:murein L,D-transpeptidase YcbB/YkuD
MSLATLSQAAAQSTPQAAAPGKPSPTDTATPAASPATMSASTNDTESQATQANPPTATDQPEPSRAQTAATTTPAANPEPTATASSPQPEAVAATAQPAADEALTIVREILAGAPPDKTTSRDDWKALQAFYADRPALHWIARDGTRTRQGDAVAKELGRADDWGLRTRDFALPGTAAGKDARARAEAEVALAATVLKYARYARGGRVDPASLSRYFDQKPPVLDPAMVLTAITATEVPGEYLVSLHPKHPQFRLLRQALLKLRSGETVSKPEPGDNSIKLPGGPTLRKGESHPQVALLRKRLGISEADAERFDETVETAVKKYQSAHGLTPDGLVGGGTRAALNGERTAQRSERRPEDRILLTMERWRWLPADLGDFHVWDNIPEYRTRVIDHDKVVHQARIIVGKPETQTPLFSADMRYIVFHPDWGVPNSIKVKEILPYLRPQQSFWGWGETDTRVLQRHNLRVSLGGRPVDPSRIDWSRVDIRRYDFIQPPGGANVLGTIKFRFPNKHDVYMHDTSQRELFKRGARTFSHGCVRVEDPRRLAEVLLSKDKGWGSDKIGSLLAGSHNNSIELSTRIPVHITYATAVAAADGTVTYHPDIYGHDNRLALALDGKALAIERIADAGEETREVRRQQVRRRVSRPAPPPNDFFSALFGN